MVESKRMKTILICFAGRIGSGKTTVSKVVADTLKWQRASFGDCVRMEAFRQGLDESRQVLQRLGESLVEDPDKFCRLLLKKYSWKPGQNLIIDGIRHSKILDSLRKLTDPSEVFLVFVSTDEKIIKKRFAEENPLRKDDLMSIEAHSTETEVKTILPAKSSLIVDGARPIKILVKEIMAWLKSYSDSHPKDGIVIHLKNLGNV